MKVKLRVKLAIYGSHALSRIGDRTFAFAVPVLFASIYEHTLMPTAMFILASKLSCAVFGTLVGWLIDTKDRLGVLSVSLFVQNLTVLISGLGMGGLMLMESQGENSNVYWPFSSVWMGLLFLGVVFFGSVAEVMSMMNDICVTKDWCVIVSKYHELKLTDLNSVMKRIDLVSDISSPFVFTGIQLLFNEFWSIVVISLYNLVSLFPEWLLSYYIYRKTPVLNRESEKQWRTKVVEREEISKELEKIDDDNEFLEDEELEGPTISTPEVLLINKEDDKEDDVVISASDSENQLSEKGQSDIEIGREDILPQKRSNIFKRLVQNQIFAWSVYVKSAAFLPSLAYVLLYFTVLSSGALLLTYYKAAGLNTLSISLFKSGSAFFGVIATFVSPLFIKCFGHEKGGNIGLVAQLLCISIACALFYFYMFSSFNWILYIMMFFVVISRLGLWIFDLAEVEIMQRIEENRGIINSVERILTKLAQLLMFMMAALVSDPKYFGILVGSSFTAVLGATILYNIWFFFRKRPKQPIDELEEFLAESDDPLAEENFDELLESDEPMDS